MCNFLSICFTGAANLPKLGTRPQIVGGENVTSITQIPWQVLVYNDVLGGACGGVLIDDDWVITAAHCIENKG
jgi:secreted trypsin-like serine protease